MSTKTTPNGYNLDDSGQRVVVDPVTRIEGHMRCEVNVDEENIIRNAVSTGTMWRGLEVILKGRDPRDAWAFTQRICGVCTGTHALTSVRAVEDALKIEIPENANSIRNIMQLTLQIHDHLVHFYHLHALDWVNPVNALKADPRGDLGAAAEGGLPQPPHVQSPGYFRDIQTRMKQVCRVRPARSVQERLLGQVRPIKMPPEADLMAVAHYLEALDLQKEIVKVHTVFGGKNPHPQLPGRRGVPCRDQHGRCRFGRRRPALNMVSAQFQFAPDYPGDRVDFVPQCLRIPDVIAIGQYLQGLAPWWRSLRRSFGDGLMAPYPTMSTTTSRTGILMLPGGAILNGNLDEVFPRWILRDPEQVQEFVASLLVQLPGRQRQRSAPLGRGHRRPNFAARAGNTKGYPRPISRKSTRAPSTPGSRPRAGAVMPWRSVRWRATWSAMPATGQVRTSRSTSSTVLLRSLDVPTPGTASRTLGRTAGACPGGGVLRRRHDALLLGQAHGQHQGRRHEQPPTWTSGIPPPGPRKPRAWA